MYITCKWGPKGKQDYVSIWGGSLGFYIGQCPMFKIIGHGPMNVDLSGKKKTGLCFYFGEGSISRLLCRAVPNVPKILVVGQSMRLLLKEKRKNSRGAPHS
jgi:hypothetical protein